MQLRFFFLESQNQATGKGEQKMNSKNKRNNKKKNRFLACNNLLQSLDSQSDGGGDSGQKT